MLFAINDSTMSYAKRPRFAMFRCVLAQINSTQTFRFISRALYECPSDTIVILNDIGV